MKTEEKPVIIVEGVKKQYQIGAIGGKTLQREIQSWWARKRGKEDPNVPVFIDQRLIGEKFMALNGVDLKIYRGERLGIIGINGAGKSTLLKLLSRVTAPTEGDIYIHGRVSSMLEIGTGFHGEMTGRENIYMNGMILGMSRAEIDEKMEDIIDFSEVREFIDTPVKRYSSGMFVKLAFSVAAHLNSEIMIMDEVLAVGDMAFQNKCIDKMRATAEEDGRTILYVSHNMDTIRKLCDRCIVMNEGKIIYDGDVDSAVSIYMNSCMADSDIQIDLSEAAHLGKGQKFGEYSLRMQHIELKDKMQAEYEEGEDLILKIRVEVREAISCLQFRVTLKTDKDIAMGTSWSEEMSLDRTGEHIVEVSFPLNDITKGNFYADIGFYTKDEIGRMITHDQIIRAFRITVPGNPAWYERAFGYIRLPEASVQIDAGEES